MKDRSLLLDIRGGKIHTAASFHAECANDRAMTFWLFAVSFLHFSAQRFCNRLTRRSVSLIYYFVSFCMLRSAFHLIHLFLPSVLSVFEKSPIKNFNPTSIIQLQYNVLKKPQTVYNSAINLNSSSQL